MKMKHAVGIAIIVSFCLVAALLIAGLYASPKLGGRAVAGNTTQGSSQGTTGTTSILTPAVVAVHATAQSCWLIIDGKVYDVTSYLSQHPGNAETILPYCGKDGSAAFATKDKGQPHSPFAASLLNKYYVGDLNAQIQSSVVQARVNQSQATVPPRSHDDDDELEDD